MAKNDMQRKKQVQAVTRSQLFYFAYGSNMLTERLVARCPGARVVGRASACDFAVSYCVRGGDGSAKAGLMPHKGAMAWGVVFELAEAEWPVLDFFEGTPDIYCREPIALRAADDAPLQAWTYFPQQDHLTTSGHPYDWYQALCLGGIAQHGLPQEARAALDGPVADIAPDCAASAQKGRAIALAALNAAGLTVASARAA